MIWRDAVIDALRRIVQRKGNGVIARSEIIKDELSRIIEDTGSKGKTPDYTLSRVLQDLRDEGVVEFVNDEGDYRLIS